MPVSYVAISIFLAAASVYALPGIIAVASDRHRHWAILVLNLALGWTLVGWIAALVWACTPYRPRAKSLKTARSVVKVHSNDNLIDMSDASYLDWESPLDDPYAEWLEHGDYLSTAPSTRSDASNPDQHRGKPARVVYAA